MKVTKYTKKWLILVQKKKNLKIYTKSTMFNAFQRGRHSFSVE